MNARSSSNDSIAKLKREAAALEKLVTDLRRAMSDLPPTGGQAFDKVRGRLAWPVAGKIAARFGQSRGGGLKWNGVMIESPRGTAVKAIYDGRIAYADWLPGMGFPDRRPRRIHEPLRPQRQLYKASGGEGGRGDRDGGGYGGRSKPGLYLEIRRGAKR
jgi:septal ring factor EnvC (AmiA/AmiB activator)